MAKKKATRKLSVGTRVRIKSGVTAPEFPEVLCEGWTGSIVDLIGKKTPQYVIEWDQTTLKGLPLSYREQCEEKNLLYSMAVFDREAFDVVED